ncbi:hypothetical protein G9A89_017562 [Geosiphon pyriformis]|nr:hypothetical protein G9A89_017562 [Geosiphon pyriformis]
MAILNGHNITSPLIPLCIAEMFEELQKVYDTKPTRDSPTRRAKGKQFFESDKHAKEMLKKDSTTNHSTTTAITQSSRSSLYKWFFKFAND